MEIKQIIVFKESRTGEGRVALTPAAVSLLAKKGLPNILVESCAGKLAQCPFNYLAEKNDFDRG